MSLIDNAMEKAYIMDKITSRDGYGGVITTWKEGAEIQVAFSFDTSTQARIAQQEGVNNRYTLTTRKSVVLRFPDIIKRASDNKYFKITSDGDDNKTPGTAGLDLRQVEAERWDMTSNE